MQKFYIDLPVALATYMYIWQMIYEINAELCPVVCIPISIWSI